MTSTANNTILILGAGASNEVGVPVGSELKTKIAKLLDIRYEHGFRQTSGSREIDAAFRQKVKDGGESINPYLHAGWNIRDAMPQAISIDNFLDAHAGDLYIETAGKLGITKAILDAERKSMLWVPPHSDPNMVNFGQLQDSWFIKFFQLLTENCRASDVPERLSKVTIISFNYDRCIAQYLYFALQNYFVIDKHQVADYLTNLEIFYPYGKVGSLPWQNEGENSTEFGGELSDQRLLDISSQIRTFTEGTNPETSEIETMRQRIINSKQIIFLGFAYHRLNMELLKFEQGANAPVSVYGTAFGISHPDSEVIKGEIKNLLRMFGDVQIRNDLRCGPLFSEYWRSMSMV